MAGSPYASSLGRLQSQFPSFLSKETYANLAQAKDVGEVTKLLEGTHYGPEIGQFAASYKGPQLIEIAVNRTFIRRNRQAYEATPFAGRALVAAYLRRWDIQNLGLILSSKAQNRPLQEVEVFLVSSRDIPAGLAAGQLTIDELRLLMQQPSLEGVVQALVKYGYGATLLPLLDAYERTRDIFPLLTALEREYYGQLLASAKFFQGDEWVIRQFLKSEVDVRNALLLLKGKDNELPLEAVSDRFLDGGDLPRSAVEELYSARTVPEMVAALASRFPTIADGNSLYSENRSLTGYEAALQRDRAVREVKRLRSYPLSIAVIFSWLLYAELERADIRRIVYGKLYAIPPARLEPLLVMTKL